ncbi:MULTISPECIES: hypothetical protein [unclassified Ruegeria]|uniref:hypothetical protein n=1 Tax=unclassified Ruegeria TaxID=2625375 RepID=UPI001489B8F1|nr:MULTISPECIES: hypothetical protein [unclassified Ruegeria]NOD76633.1 hypothetical protein [Ruegeria sp. HKCCD4332]NOD89353.1 hypothetical protein [Ruegeria sp. HKCCD4318]NOD92813.1 hypothetical protein [Ruegeria sp. HKCCD4884]NOE13484.1 hypothetical protein [Ruegeria sp. HKCCD4318-2]NOG07767.1 hypothetical protein [Ruegeria sp. HKCCD4315]
MRVICTLAVLFWAGASEALTTLDGAESVNVDDEVRSELLSGFDSERHQEELEWENPGLPLISEPYDENRYFEELELLGERTDQEGGMTEGTLAQANLSAVPIPASWLLLVGALAGLFGLGKLRGNRSA